MSDQNPFTSGSDPVARDEHAPDNAAPVEMDVGPILSRCWDLFTANPGLVIGTLLIPLVPACGVGVVDAGISIATEGDRVDEGLRLGLQLVDTSLQILNWLVSIFLGLGVTRIFLNLARGAPAELGMLVGGGAHFLSALGASIVMGLGVVVGLLLLIVPGIVLIVGLQFWMYAMVDQRLGAIDALQESWRLTDGYKMTVAVIDVVVVILAVLITCVTLGLGYFLVLPVLSLMNAVMYHALTHLNGHRGQGLTA